MSERLFPNPVFLVLLVSLLSCNAENQVIDSTEGVLKQVIPESLERGQTINQDVSELEFIPLRSGEKVFLGEIKKMLIKEDYLIILCYGRSSVYVFDRSGEFQFRIGSTGSGPLEFSSLQDVIVFGSYLIISDNELGKVLQYDLSQRSFTKEWLFEFAPFAMEMDKDYLYMLTNGSSDGFIKSAKNLDFSDLNTSIAAKPPFNLISSIQPFLLFQEQLFLSGSFSDTIYQARHGVFQPFAVIGNMQTSVANINSNVLIDAFFSRDPEASKQIEHTFITAGYVSAVNEKWIIRLQNPVGHFIIYDYQKEESVLVDENRYLDEIRLLTGVPYPSFKFQDEDGYVYMGFLPTENWYEGIIELPTDHPIRRAAESGLGEYFGDPTFENPVLVKFKPGKAFMEVERR